MHYYGQLAALTDCMLQSMYTSKYVVFSDLDEVIVPTNHSNWTEMINSIDGANHGNNGVYLFRNSFVVLEHENSRLDVLPSNYAWMAQHYRILSLLKRQRNQKIWQREYYSKCIVNPRGVETVGIHVMHQLLGGFQSIDVDPASGILWHYRKACYSCTILPGIEDNRMLFFANEITKGIIEVHGVMNMTQPD